MAQTGPDANAYEEPVTPGWRGRFQEYLELVAANPALADSAHRRIWRMIERAGMDRGGYAFFNRQIFGIDHAIRALVDGYFRPAAQGFDVKKRIVLLVGPVSGGKSSIVTLLKRGLEQFTATDAGALYAISGCPMHEDPLHLLPARVRARMGFEVQGELCPWCRWQLEHVYGGRIHEVPVERVVLSETRRVGIGTYAPSDPKSQDIADLTGSVDFHAIAQYGAESDPRAFRFDGELNIANRGLMEFQEMLKLDPKFLYHLLSLSQEGNFKTGRYELIGADEVVIGHTNEREFRAFRQNPQNEALLSRLFPVAVPYNMHVDEEVRIYQRLLAPHVPARLHLSPRALGAAATIAVLSRIREEPKPGGDRLSKLERYRGAEAESPQWEGPMDEGMSGLDPRHVINRLSALLADPERPCLDGMEVLKAFRLAADSDPLMEESDRSRLSEWVDLAKGLYDREVQGDVLAAFAEDWSAAVANLYQNYVDNVLVAVSPATHRTADMRLMRAVEDRAGVTELQAEAFREEIVARLNMAQDGGGGWTFLEHPALKAALEQKVFDDMRDEIKITAGAAGADPVMLRRIEQAAERLVATGTYCPRCAARAIRHVGELLNR